MVLGVALKSGKRPDSYATFNIATARPLRSTSSEAKEGLQPRAHSGELPGRLPQGSNADGK